LRKISFLFFPRFEAEFTDLLLELLAVQSHLLGGLGDVAVMAA